MKSPPKRSPPLHPRGRVHYTTELDKFQINYCHSMGFPTSQIVTQSGFPESTIRSTIQSFQRYEMLTPKRGRPHVTRGGEAICSEVTASPFLTLHKQSADNHIPLTAVYSIRTSPRIHFYKIIPMPLLDDRHRSLERSDSELLEFLPSAVYGVQCALSCMENV
jgi:hypothetical protein